MIRLMQNHFLKNAWRNLWKHRTIGFVNIAGLAIGMAAAFMVLLWVQNEFTFDGFQPDANREYLVTWMDKTQKIFADGSPIPLTREAMQRIPGIEGITSYYPHGLAPEIIHIDAEIRTAKNFIFADSNWFQFFQYDFLAGSGRDFGRRNGIILTARLAERYFGAGTAVGRAVRIDSTDYYILGVIKDNPANSSCRALERFDGARMIVALHLEGDCPTIPDIDHTGVFFSRLHENFRSSGRKFLQFESGVLVGTMFAPHHRKNAQLCEIRFSAQDRLDTVVLFLC